MERRNVERVVKRTQSFVDDGSNDGDHISDDESEPNEEPRKAKTVKKQKVVDSDVDEVDDQNEELNNDENIPFEAGQICQVYVENFMCHRKFTVGFTRHLNFVNGQNGSGEFFWSNFQNMCESPTF